MLCGLAPTLHLLIAGRALQGPAGRADAVTMALVRDSVADDRMGRAMGLLGTMSALGTALGPSLGGLLLVAGWQAIFLVNLPLGVAAFWLAASALPADHQNPEGAKPGFDVIGTVLLALALGAYALATTVGSGHFGWLNAALLAAALLSGIVFVLAQKRSASPLIRLAALREASLGASLGTNGLVSTVMMATLVVGPFYLLQGLGMSAAMTGLVLSIGPAVSAFSGVPAAAWSTACRRRASSPSASSPWLRDASACLCPPCSGLPAMSLPSRC